MIACILMCLINLGLVVFWVILGTPAAPFCAAINGIAAGVTGTFAYHIWEAEHYYD